MSKLFSFIRTYIQTYSARVDFRQGAASVSNRSVYVIHEDCEPSGNTAQNSSVKSMDFGFSLIELLFVIAVLGVLSTTGVLFYQQFMQNQKIDKTVTEIERWMQASTAYYMQRKQWPANADVLINEGYMPTDAEKHNPWCRVNNDIPACYLVVPGSQGVLGPLLNVTAIIPVGDPIRTRIADRLAYTDRSPTVPANQVRALVNVPSSRNNPNEVLVRVIPFTLNGAELKMENKFFVTKEPNGKTIGIVPDCGLLYGAEYQFASYTVLTDYVPDIRYRQQRLTSALSVSVQGGAAGSQLTLKLKALVNEYDLENTWLPNDVVSIPAVSVPTNLKVAGQVFVLCEKKK